MVFPGALICRQSDRAKIYEIPFRNTEYFKILARLRRDFYRIPLILEITKNYNFQVSWKGEGSWIDIH